MNFAAKASREIILDFEKGIGLLAVTLQWMAMPLQSRTRGVNDELGYLFQTSFVVESSPCRASRLIIKLPSKTPNGTSLQVSRRGTCPDNQCTDDLSLHGVITSLHAHRCHVGHDECFAIHEGIHANTSTRFTARGSVNELTGQLLLSQKDPRSHSGWPEASLESRLVAHIIFGTRR